MPNLQAGPRPSTDHQSGHQYSYVRINRSIQIPATIHEGSTSNHTSRASDVDAGAWNNTRNPSGRKQSDHPYAEAEINMTSQRKQSDHLYSDMSDVGRVRKQSEHLYASALDQARKQSEHDYAYADFKAIQKLSNKETNNDADTFNVSSGQSQDTAIVDLLMQSKAGRITSFILNLVPWKIR